MITYRATFEQTSFLPVRQYEAKTIDDLMRLIQQQKMTAQYDLTVTIDKIDRDDEMRIKGESVDFVEFTIKKDKSAYQAEINKLKGEVAYRNKQIETLEQQIRELKGELYAGKEQIRQLKETNEHLVEDVKYWQQPTKRRDVMNKEQQIEELHDFILNNLYKGSTHLLAEKLYNAGYRKTFTSDLASDTQKAFKEGYEKGCETCVQAWDNGYNDGYESGKEDGVKEFAEKIKEKSYVNNYCREVVEIEKIDELLKEYEE